MKWGDSNSVLWRGILLVVAIIALGFFTPAYGQTKDVMLLLEQSPVKGGDISPVAGTYHFEPNSQVALTATPKPGYRFLHWLGDVSDPTATKTVVHLSKPKIIVAVFEQNKHRLDKPEGLSGSGGGGGGLISTPADLRLPGSFSAGGGSTRPKTQPHTYVIKGNEPVPEPATGVLLLVGGLLVLRRRTGRIR
ncbi:PEP-CTERM sorting domain-containing protein [Planctomycetota bacterium]